MKGLKEQKGKEVEEAGNNQSSKGNADDCAGTINDRVAGDAGGVVQVGNDENNKIIFGDTLLK